MAARYFQDSEASEFVQVDLCLRCTRWLGGQSRRATDNVDLIDRVCGRPARTAIGVARRAGAFTDDTPRVRLRHRQIEGHERPADERVPAAGARQVDAGPGDDAGCGSKAARVLLAGIRQGEVEDASVLDTEGRTCRGQHHAVPLDGRRRPHVAALHLAKPRHVAERHLLDNSHETGDTQPRVQQELDFAEVAARSHPSLTATPPVDESSVTSSAW